MKSIEDRMEYFYNKLETIIDDPMTKCDSKINALKVYSAFFPTETTIKTTVPTLANLDSLSTNDKKELKSIISQIKKSS